MSSDNTNTNTNTTNGSTPARRRPQRRAARESPYGTNPTAPTARPTGTTNGTNTNNPAPTRTRTSGPTGTTTGTRDLTGTGDLQAYRQRQRSTTTTIDQLGADPEVTNLAAIMAQLGRTMEAVDGTPPAAAGAGTVTVDENLRVLSVDSFFGLRLTFNPDNRTLVEMPPPPLPSSTTHGFDAVHLHGVVDHLNRAEAADVLIGVEPNRGGLLELRRRVSARREAVRQERLAPVYRLTNVGSHLLRAGAALVATGLDNALGSTGVRANGGATLALAPGAASAGRRRGSTAAVDEDGQIAATLNGGHRIGERVMNNAPDRERRLRDLAAATASPGTLDEFLRLATSNAAAATAFPGTLDEVPSAEVRANGGATLAPLGADAASAGRRGGSAAAGANGAFLFGAEEKDDEDAELQRLIDDGEESTRELAGRAFLRADDAAIDAAEANERSAANTEAIAELQERQDAFEEEMEEIRQEQQEIRRRLPPKKGKGGKRGGKK